MRRNTEEGRLRRKHVIGNWKMNLPAVGMDHYLKALSEWSISDSVSLTVAPPFPFLSELRADADLHNLECDVAAQNCSDRPFGAFTGEVSAAMVKLTGASRVIVGHSERRTIFGESDAEVAASAVSAALEGLAPIVCIGEPLWIREEGSVYEFLRSQLQASLNDFDADANELVLAYEPIWAIGTGRNATPEIASETIGTVRECLARVYSDAVAARVPILYGGSVSPENAAELAAGDGVDGFLVGGASLDAAAFRVIYEAVAARL